MKVLLLFFLFSLVLTIGSIDYFQEAFAQEPAMNQETLHSLFENPEETTVKLNQQILDLLTSELAKLSPLKQFELGTPLHQIECKSDRTIVLKSVDNSPACVKLSSLTKLMERNWIKPAYAQELEKSELAIVSTKIPPDSQRAMMFVVTITDTPLKIDLKPIFTISKFKHLSSILDEAKADLPRSFDKTKPPQFILESLPSLDKRQAYDLINGFFLETNPFTEPFNVQVEIVAGNGEVIHSFDYGQCVPITFTTYVQDSLIFYQFQGKFEPEIREKYAFSCSHLRVSSGDPEKNYSEFFNN